MARGRKFLGHEHYMPAYIQLSTEIIPEISDVLLLGSEACEFQFHLRKQCMQKATFLLRAGEKTGAIGTSDISVAAQMTAIQTGGPEYDARIRRADRLAAQYLFASEFLDFYKHIAAFQKSLRASIAASGGTKSSRVPALELRAPLDFTVLLPHFRGFLSTIEQHAPPALARSARQMSLLPSDSWIASLEAYWEQAGKYDQQVGAFAQFLSRAFLQPYAEFRAALLPKPPVVVTTRVCPLCTSRPLSGVLRVEGDSGKRFLLCSFCSQEWEFRRIHREDPILEKARDHGCPVDADY